MNPIMTKTQTSAGGVAFRRRGARVEVALISVGERGRWQLPKGLVGADEATEAAALREVREETGLETELIAPVETVEYWYVATERGARVRFHKVVHFTCSATCAGRSGSRPQFNGPLVPPRRGARHVAFETRKGRRPRAEKPFDNER